MQLHLHFYYFPFLDASAGGLRYIVAVSFNGGGNQGCLSRDQLTTLVEIGTDDSLVSYKFNYYRIKYLNTNPDWHGWPFEILVILFRSFGFLACRDFGIVRLYSYLTVDMPYGG
jgi:hypothetical protein